MIKYLLFLALITPAYAQKIEVRIVREESGAILKSTQVTVRLSSSELKEAIEDYAKKKGKWYIPPVKTSQYSMVIDCPRNTLDYRFSGQPIEGQSAQMYWSYTE